MGNSKPGNFKPVYHFYNSEEYNHSYCHAINHDNTILLIVDLHTKEIHALGILRRPEDNAEKQPENEQDKEDFELNEKAFKKISIIQGNLGDVKALQFLKSDKYKNSFISGSGFALCFFVPYNQSQPEFWIEKFRIPWVQADFNTFEISSYENFMVTGDNENVKFWSFENQFVCQQIIAQHESSIQALSINPDENSVISIALKDHYINVMAISDKQIWYVKQVIQSPDVLQKICFITNQIFVAQLGQGYQATKDIQLFKINTAEKFYMFNKIPIKGKGENWYFSFQTVYNPIKQILILQNGKQLNIIRFTNLNTQFKSNQGYFECNMVLKLQLFMEHQVMMESFQQLGMTNLIELKQEYIIMKMNKNNIINIENIDVQKLYFLIYFFLEFKG